MKNFAFIGILVTSFAALDASAGNSLSSPIYWQIGQPTNLSFIFDQAPQLTIGGVPGVRPADNRYLRCEFLGRLGVAEPQPVSVGHAEPVFVRGALVEIVAPDIIEVKVRLHEVDQITRMKIGGSMVHIFTSYDHKDYKPFLTPAKGSLTQRRRFIIYGDGGAVDFLKLRGQAIASLHLLLELTKAKLPAFVRVPYKGLKVP